MRKSSISSLPGYNELFNDHNDDHHPGIISDPPFIIEIFQEPSHCPAEYPDGKKKLRWFDKGIDTENYNISCLGKDNTNNASNKIDPTEIIKNRVSSS